MRLAGKVVFLTGTSPNIGGGLAEVLAEEGAAIACVDFKPDYADACADAVRKTGGRACAIACDITDATQVECAVRETVETFGKVDVLINNAVIFNRKGVLDMPVEEWRRQIDVILTGAFLATKYCAARMVEPGAGGSIINVISTAGHQGEPGNIAYSTAKAGLLNFTRSAAMELASRGVRVNSLTPTATEPSDAAARAARWGLSVTRSPGAEGRYANFRRGVPMQRLPEPRHYGKAAAFLASDDAEMITGEDLRVDGGAVARYWAWDPSATGRVERRAGGPRGRGAAEVARQDERQNL